MNEDESDAFQLRFKDLRLVEPATEYRGGNDYTTDPVEPGDQTGFVVEARSGALDANERLVTDVETHDWTSNSARQGQRSM